jgi:predicted lipid carrier protein YhbT
MAKKTSAAKDSTSAAEDRIRRLAEGASERKALRAGHIVLRLTGSHGGHFAVRVREGKVDVLKDVPAGHHAIEVIGDAQRVLAVLEGKKDARAQFLAGGFRVRGDVRYINDLALAMGILKSPIGQ